MRTITKDPVCGMEAGESSAFRSELGGSLYLFCSEKCLKKFERDPGEFIESEEKNRGPGEENFQQADRGANWSDYIPLMVIIALALLAACAKQNA